MTGLMLKDFLILRKNMRTYLLFIVLYGGLAFTGVWSPEFVGGFIMVLTAMLPMNVFAYDKQAKWDTYGLALPVGRTKTVAARYLCVLLLCLFSVLLEFVIGGAMFAAGKLEEPSSYLATCAVCGLIAVLVNSVMLPFLYKFGPEQARIALFVLMGGIVLLGVLFLGPLGGMEWLESLGEPTPAQITALPVIAAIAGVVLLAVSFLLSRHFYGAKDV
ncbi:MAG: ABC-2 transporter permease [Oscillospiraceae bacterium]|nr:ABC-2 transporter permease [Oscillospiraceae bacterium]